MSKTMIMKKLNILHYNPKLKEKARELRKNSTLSEVLLWNELKAGKMHGYQFLRQKPIDEYIVDFFCKDLMLAIEIDGYSHDGRYEYDMKRQHRLESLDIRFLRFPDKMVKTDMPNVLLAISGWIEAFEKEVRL